MPAIDILDNGLGAVWVVALMIVFGEANKDHSASTFAERDIGIRRYQMFV
jgi:hypothetical protein